MGKIAESHVEDATLSWLGGLGYGIAHGPDISPDGAAPERASYGEVLLLGRLRDALARLNPHLDADVLDAVVRRLQQAETPSLVEENRRLHRLMVEGVPVEVTRADGRIGRRAAPAWSTLTILAPTTGWWSTSTPSSKAGTIADPMWWCWSTACRSASSS